MRVEDADDDEFDNIIKDKRRATIRGEENFKGSFVGGNQLNLNCKS